MRTINDSENFISIIDAANSCLQVSERQVVNFLNDTHKGDGSEECEMKCTC